MTARLSSGLMVGALMRLAEVRGGFAAIVRKGDETAGSVLVILTERGAKSMLLERVLRPDGSYEWQSPNNQIVEKTAELETLIARRQKYDPDLWVVELDVPSLERFAAEMNAAN